MRLVVLQPFYLPYCGVFELVRLADTFVLYDDVQFVRRNWQHRNRVMTAQGPQWLSVPVRATRGDLLRDVTVAADERWQSRHWRTLEQSYGSAPHGPELLQAIEPHYEAEWTYLADVNMATFSTLCERLEVDARFLRSSDLGIEGRASARILAHCTELGADHYLTGPSARDYLDEESFAEAGVQLEYLEFDHPVYPQHRSDEFEPYLSVVDLLANVGPAAGALLAGTGTPVPAQHFGPTTSER